MAGYDVAQDKRSTATRSTGGDKRSDRSKSGVDHTKTNSTDDRSLFDRIWSGLFGGDMGGDSVTAPDEKKTTPVDKNYKERYPQWSSYKSKAAEVSGVAESYYDRLIGIESKGKPTATSSTGATGLPQWTSRTGKQYGLFTKADRQRTDEKGAIALGKFTRDNKAYLEKKLGRAPTQGELYLAHQEGAPGAVGLLTNPDKRARDVVGFTAVNVNLPSGVSRNLTAREFAARWTSKFDGQQNIGGKQVSARPTNNDATLFGSSRGFWATILGTDDEVEIYDTVQSIRSGSIGRDPDEPFTPRTPRDDTVVNFVETNTFGATDGGYTIDNMKTGAISAAGNQEITIDDPGGEGDGTRVTISPDQHNVPSTMRRVILPDGSTKIVGTNLLSGLSNGFTDVMGNLATGNVGGALSSFGKSVFGSVGSNLFGGALGTVLGGPLGGIMGALGLGLTGDNSNEDGSSILAFIQEYFLRLIVIILGLIFVAVGLSMFRNNQQIVMQIKKAVK